MPAGTVQIYGAAKEAFTRATIDLDSDTFVVTLHSSSYTPSLNTHATWADVSGSQLSTGNGYTAGGSVLSGVTVTRSGGTVTFDASDVSWPSSTLTAKYAVITKRAGASLVSGDLLLAYVDLETGGGGTISTTNGTLSIAWNAAGIFTLS